MPTAALLRRELKLPDFRDYAVEVKQAGKVLYENTRPLGEFLRDTMRDNMTSFRVFGPDETASNRLQSIYQVSKKTWMADTAARGCRRRRTRARWPGDGDALGAHADGMAGRLPALRPPWLLPHLRGLRARGGLDVQPAREVARHLQEPRAVARLGGVGEHPAVVDRLAAGPQRLLAPGPGLHRPGDQQEPERHARLPSAGRQHPARGGRPVPALDRLHQRHRRRQAEAPAVHHHGAGHRALRQGHRHLGRREQRRRRGARRGDGLVRRRGDPGGAGGHRDPARAAPRPEAALRQRRGPVQDAAGRASIRTDRPTASSTACSPSTSRSSSTSTAIPG